MSALTAVRVRYEVERTVYVNASTKAEARRLARDDREWVDADSDYHEHTDRVQVLSSQAIAVGGSQ